MSVSNRLELAPYLLVVVDFAVACCAAIAVLPLGIAQIAVPVLVLLVVYASGEYSLLSEVTLPRRFGIAVACCLFMTICGMALLLPNPLWAVPWTWRTRFGVALLGCIAFAGAHYGLEGFLRARCERFLLHLRPDMWAAGEALQRHASRCGYPAGVVFDEDPRAAPDRMRADLIYPRKDQESEPETLTVRFDPARFCDIALKVLPPAVLERRKDYVRWEACERRGYDLVKRAFDTVAASVLFLVSLPLMAGAAIGIAVADGRPVLFRQTRVGRYGRRFSLLKFRTLHEEASPSATPNDAIENRVFRFGAFLRRTRLDELPQFINIVRGDMSLIGPRPEMEFFHEIWVSAIPFYRKRLLVRPGLSGWAQIRFIHTTSEADYWDKTAYDLWYIKNRNIIIDARILLRTIGVMLFGSGAR
ncbi:MAG: sugar transferase [Spirochaetia bacterium]|jgi:lipopolysaccharide/colanic/teichoic acid biosynthesis glycosyltransferase